jgi:hypothetical protein
LLFVTIGLISTLDVQESLVAGQIIKQSSIRAVEGYLANLLGGMSHTTCRKQTPSQPASQPARRHVMNWHS